MCALETLQTSKKKKFTSQLMKYDDKIDATGLLCPLPVLKIRKKLNTMDVGEVLFILADDPAAIVDIPHFCNEQGYTLIESQKNDNLLSFSIRKTQSLRSKFF